MKNYFLALMCFAVLGLASSCKDDEEDCANDLQNAVAKSAEVLSASLTYAADSSTANCQALKTALEEFIDAAEPVADCDALTDQQRQEYLDDIDEAEDNIQELNQKCP